MDDTQLRSLQVLQQADHDTLTRVETKVDLFSINITNELKRISLDFTAKMTDHESRIRLLEKSRDSLNPEDIKVQLEHLERSINKSNINWKVVGIIGGILTVLIGAAVPIIVALTKK